MLSPDQRCVSGGDRAAHDGTKILRVLHPIERDGDQRRSRDHLGPVTQFERWSDGDGALMLPALRAPIHLSS